MDYKAFAVGTSSIFTLLISKLEKFVCKTLCLSLLNVKLGSTAQLEVSDFRSRGYKFESQLSHITFMKTDHEVISTTVLPILLIQEGQWSVTEESMCTSTG